MARKATVIGDGDSKPASDTGNHSGDANGNSGIEFEPGKPLVIDPAAFLGDTGSDSGRSSGDGGDGRPGASDPPKRRGRKPGSTNKKASQNFQLETDAISAILLSTHQMLSVYSKIPELEIDVDESEKLAKGIANVARHYDTKVSAKALDWYYLIQVLVLIYGTRLYAIRERKRLEKEEPDMSDTSVFAQTTIMQEGLVQ